MPSSVLFEAEIDLLQLLEYKPILSKGYTCMIHIHTFAEEITVKDLLWAIEKDPGTQEEVKKEKPKFTRSFAKILCRVTCNKPIPLEKAADMASLGRFTLRDEGKTIAVGRVIKYKPFKEAGKKEGTADMTNKAEEAKSGGNSGLPASTKGDVVFNLETGATEQKQPELVGIAEADEGDV